MAILKNNDISKMTNKEREGKVQELKMELMKERVNLAKGGKIKIKEIKRTIAKLLTFNRQEQPAKHVGSRLLKSKHIQQQNKPVENK